MFLRPLLTLDIQASPEEESVKIIEIETCEECPNIGTDWDEEKGESIWTCDHPDVVGPMLIVNPESIHPDCPLEEADRTSGQEEGEDALA